MRIRIGTSGYSFDDWVARGGARADEARGQGTLFASASPERPTFPFYPPGVRDRLAFYAEHFDTVEINSTYYHMPRAQDCASWAKRTPLGFSFWVKVPGTVTHERRVADCDEFRAAVAPLREAGKLAGVLAQFPMAFRRGEDARRHLTEMAAKLPDDPLAIEFRHRSWDRPDTHRMLADLGLQQVAVDEPRLHELFPSRPLATDVRRVRVGVHPPAAAYLRFHSRAGDKWFKGEAERYDYLYSDEELRQWLPWLTQLHELETPGEVYVYFNNCKRGQAIENARRLKKLLGVA